MHDIFYIQPNFSKQHTAQRISISLRQDGFSFVIHAADSDTLLAAFHTTIPEPPTTLHYIEALQTFFAHDALQQSFERVSIVYVTPKITIIPSALFSAHTLSLLFETNHVLLPTESVLHYSLQKTDGYIVFAMPQTIIDACNTKFGTNIRILPQAAPFLESGCIQNKLVTTKQVHVNIEQSFIDIAVFDGQKILLHNTFEYSNNNDYMYFVMNVYEQLQLHPMEHPLVLSGIISKASHYYESAQMFIQHVNIVEPSQSHKYFLSHPFEPATYPLFSNLCNVSLCE